MRNDAARMTRAQESRLKALEPALAKVSDSDRDFFARYAGRSYRLRRISEAEVQTLGIIFGADTFGILSGFVRFVAVRRITPAIRFRAYGAMPPLGGDDPPEAFCRACYETWTVDQPKLRDLANKFIRLHAVGKIP